MIKRWQKPLLIAVALLVLLAAALSFLVYRSLPGEKLFGFKTNVWEEVLELARITPEARAEYHATVLERRLHETERLASEETLNEGDLRFFYDETRERSNELIAHLAAEEDAGLSREAVLMYNHELESVLQAMEEMAEGNDVFISIEEDIEDQSRKASNMFDDRAEQYTAWGTDEEVRQFITDLLGDVLARVEEGDLNRSLRDDVGEQIESAQSDLAKGRGADAIEEIADALLLITVADHLGTAGEQEEAAS